MCNLWKNADDTKSWYLFHNPHWTFACASKSQANYINVPQKPFFSKLNRFYQIFVKNRLFRMILFFCRLFLIHSFNTKGRRKKWKEESMIWLLKPRKKCSSCLKFKSVHIEQSVGIIELNLEFWKYFHLCTNVAIGLNAEKTLVSKGWIQFNPINGSNSITFHRSWFMFICYKFSNFNWKLILYQKLTNISIFHLLFTVCYLRSSIQMNVFYFLIFKIKPQSLSLLKWNEPF